MDGRKGKIVIRLERDNTDYLLPRDFYDILMHRFFPVLSLTYLSSVVGIAASKGDIVHYIFADKIAYVMALFVVFWVSGPAIIWIFLKGHPVLTYAADIWYKILAGLMLMLLLMSFILFPEGNIFGLRLYFAASIPVVVIMYFFFVKGGLPPAAAYPLNALGLAALIYGAMINLLWA